MHLRGADLVGTPVPLLCSPVVRFKTFDASADGYGRGEGFAVVLMTRQQLGVPSSTAGPLAVVCGSAVNSAGRSSGLTAPSGPAQQKLLAVALASTAGQVSVADVAFLAVHGTGTPLGDPIGESVGAGGSGLHCMRARVVLHTHVLIAHWVLTLLLLPADVAEMGAVGGALSLANGSHPRVLALGSNKSCFGHTEGAAGLTGALLATMALQQQALPPVVGLREVNPYVAAALGDWHSRHSLPAVLPRQQAPMAAAAAAARRATSGTSSFGMTGVNAHMLLALPSQPGPVVLGPEAAASLPWQRQRHWPLPAPHPLLTFAAISSQQAGPAVTFSARLSTPAAVYLRDHYISGRLLLPATAFFELLLSAASTAWDAGAAATPASAARQLCPWGLAISAPKILQHEEQAADVLAVTIMTHSAAAEVASTDGTAHVRCSVSTAAHASLAELPSSSQPISAVGMALAKSSSKHLPTRHFNFAALANAQQHSTARDSWSVDAAAADAALHLSAVKVAGLTDAISRVPVGVQALLAAPPASSALRSRQQWSTSQLPAVTVDGSAQCSIHAALDAGTRLTVTNLLAKPLLGQKAVGLTKVDADTKLFEQQHFIYCIEFQTSADLGASGSTADASSSLRAVGGSGLELRGLAQLGGMAQGHAELLEGASQLRIMPHRGPRTSSLAGNSVAVAADGIELLQRVLGADDGGRSAVEALVTGAVDAAPDRSNACAPSSGMVAALLKVAAVENPTRQWAVLRGSAQATRPWSEVSAATDQHGMQVAACTLRQPRLLRMPM